MDTAAAARPAVPPITIDRAGRTLPILYTAGRTGIGIRAGTTVRIGDDTHAFTVDTPITVGDLVPGNDYAVTLDTAGSPLVGPAMHANPLDGGAVAGFHFSPGGGAEGRSGGDDVPAINPFSIWDCAFRPACPDPRGMSFANLSDDLRLWVDIYLLGTEHEKHGTSRYGATIADGNSLGRLNYQDAVDIVARHGKRLMTYDEFRVVTFGVTEKSSTSRHPGKTGLDAPRTSRFWLHQAAGNLSVWGTDGDPDDPRPSFFGGSWVYGGYAGSRFAYLGYWGGHSYRLLGVRAASDHMGPA